MKEPSGTSSDFLMAHDAEANASLCSIISISPIDLHVFSSIILTVGIGAYITLLASTPDVAYSTILANTGSPSSSAASSEAIRTADAPSDT